VPLSGIPARHRLWRVLTLKNAPTPSLFNAINKGGQLFQVPGTSCLAPFCQETPPALLPPPSSSPWLLSLFLPISVIWDPTRLPEPSSKESGTLHRRFVPKFCCEICSASSVSFWCLFFNFCSVKKLTRKDERIWTSDTYAPYDDGHQWRKYGEKKLSNSNFPRFLVPLGFFIPLPIELYSPNKFVVSVHACILFVCKNLSLLLRIVNLVITISVM